MARKNPKLCKARYCRNLRRKRGLCYKHYTQDYRVRSPYKYYYQKLRNSAKRRGIPITITLQDFIDLWARYPIQWSQKVTRDANWQVDRIDVTRGYEVGNLQVLSLIKNVHKYWDEDRHKMVFETGYIRVTKPDYSECPF